MTIQASKDWKENIGADEAELFERYRGIVHAIQQKNSAKLGPGRALHRKGQLVLPASFEVKDGLPDCARQGLFAKSGRYEAWLRLSNGSAQVQPDRKPDARGFAIKVHGVNGPGALGSDTVCQDFLLINLPAFAFPRPDEFVGLVEALSRGGLAPVFFLLRRYGLGGALRELKRLSAAMGKPFTGFACSPFYSAAPFACGPYAARMRMLPAVAATSTRTPDDLAADFVAQVEKQDLRFEIQLQFFVDEARTPIEDASVDWPESAAPYVTVATLTVARSALQHRADAAFVAQVEADSFDPWKALATHRPLGRVMRARKVIYFDSAQARKATVT